MWEGEEPGASMHQNVGVNDSFVLEPIRRRARLPPAAVAGRVAFYFASFVRLLRVLLLLYPRGYTQAYMHDVLFFFTVPAVLLLLLLTLISVSLIPSFYTFVIHPHGLCGGELFCGEEQPLDRFD